MSLIEAKLNAELASVQNSDVPYKQRWINDINGFLEFIPILINSARQDNRFNVFDFRSESKVYKVNIGEITPNLELDLFDAIRVSQSIPFVVINLNKEKGDTKGLFVSTDRRFKIYHSHDLEIDHESLINKWSTDKKMKSPYTIRIKVAIEKLGKRKRSYVDVVYKFEEGLFLQISDKYGKETIDYIIQVLQTHLPKNSFKVDPDILTSISGRFVIDNITLNKFIFRQFLITAHTIDPRSEHKLRAHQFLWQIESTSALSFRKQSKLRFKIHDLTANISISSLESKRSDKFYMNGSMVSFPKDTKYNSIKISKIKSLEEANAIKDVLTGLIYFYGLSGTGHSPISKQIAQTFNQLIFGSNDSKYFTGATFEGSKIISNNDLQQITTKINKLKAVDPSFWAHISTAKIITREYQVVAIATTLSNDWKDVVRAKFIETEYDNASYRRQILRYPFQVYDKNGVLIESPKTNVAPYFIMCSPEHPYFRLAKNNNKIGSGGTIHPYLISCVNSNSNVLIPGSNRQEQYENLIDLSRPYQIMLTTSDTYSNKNAHESIESKVLKYEKYGAVPKPVQSLFNYVYKKNVQIKRIGSLPIAESILHALLLTRTRPEHYQEYISLSSRDKELYLKKVLKKAIDKETDWNIARQELFDMPVANIKQLFMSDTFIDPALFKSVLEKFFKVYMLVITYDKSSSKIEIPRHKYFYVNSKSPKDAKPVVIFKHVYTTNINPVFYQCEIAELYLDSTKIPWRLSYLETIFDKANRTVSVNFLNQETSNPKILELSKRFGNPSLTSVNVTGPEIKVGVEKKPNLTEIFNGNNIIKQFIDGAGKLRAFVYRYNNIDITITSEPLRPIHISAIDSIDSFTPAKFDLASSLIQSLNGKNIQYKMMENYFVGIWFSLLDVTFFINTEPSVPKITNYVINNISYFEPSQVEDYFWKHDYFEKVMNIMIQLIRNLYIYSRSDDPEKFFDRYSIQITDHVYDLNVPRRLKTNRTFESALKYYVRAYSSFFTHLNGRDLFVYDSMLTRNAIVQHLKQVQTLKENIIQSTGTKLTHGWNGDNKVVVYYPNINGINYHERIGIDDFMIENIELLKHFYERPLYIEYFYVYPSDFTVRGPDQQIFMHEDDVIQYMGLRSMYNSSKTIEVPLTGKQLIEKSPQYVILGENKLYVIQNVLGSNIKSVISVLLTWKNEKVNLGYYAPEYNEEISDEDSSIPSIENLELKYLLDPPKYGIVHYDQDKYAAFFELAGYSILE